MENNQNKIKQEIIEAKLYLEILQAKLILRKYHSIQFEHHLEIKYGNGTIFLN